MSTTEPPKQLVPSPYSTYFNNEFLSDCILERSDPAAPPFKAHKLVLAANSAFFANYFKEHPATEAHQKIKIPKFVDPSFSFSTQDVFAKALQFFYLNPTLSELQDLGLNRDNAFSFLNNFAGLEHKRAQSLTKEYINKEVLTDSNCGDCLMNAIKLDDKDLKEKCMKKLAPIFGDILNDQKKRLNLLGMTLDVVKETLSKDDLKIQNENVILNFITDYIQIREAMPSREEPPAAGAPGTSSEQKPVDDKSKESAPKPAGDKPVEAKPEDKKESEQKPKEDEKKKEEEKPKEAEGEKKKEEAKEGEKKPEEKKVEEAKEGEKKPEDKKKEEGAKEGEKKPDENKKEEGSKPVPEKVDQKEGQPQPNVPAVAAPTSVARDFESEAQAKLKSYKLTKDEKRDLVKLLRLTHVTHDALIKASNMDIFADFKDIFIESLSAKLNTYENSQIEKYSINVIPRQYTQPNAGSSPSPNKNSKGPASGPYQQQQQHDRQNSGQKFNPNDMRGFPSPQGYAGNPREREVSPQSYIRDPVIYASPQQTSKSFHGNFSSPPRNNQQDLFLSDIRQDTGYGQQHHSPYSQTAGSKFYQGGEGMPGYGGQYRGPNDPFAQTSPNKGQQNFDRSYPGQFSKSETRFPNIHSNEASPPNMRDQGRDRRAPEGYGRDNNSLRTSTNNTPKVPRQTPLVFSYKYDFDDNGAFYYLGSYGKQGPWANPHENGQVQAFFSSLGKGIVADVVGRECVNCRTLNEPNSFMGVDLGVNRYLIPTCYSIRNRNSNHHVLLNWTLEASTDLKEWYRIDKRVHFTEDSSFNESVAQTREELKMKGFTSTWGVDENQIDKIKKSLDSHDRRFIGFRYFKITQINKNSSGSFNLALSGLELYGVALGENWNF